MKNRIICLFYITAFTLFTVGWYPAEQTKNIAEITAKTGKELENICVLGENNKLFSQGIRETTEFERKINEQQDETQRRKVKLVKKKKKAVAAFSIGVESQKILERIVEAEAGGQDIKGRMLVANVIMNRTKSGKFPSTVKGVVFSPGQFSPVSNGRYYQVTVSQKTKEAVKRVLQGEDYSEGALYFMCREASEPSNVSWFDRALTRLFKHGDHEFFR